MWGKGIRQKEHVLDVNVGKGIREKEHVMNVNVEQRGQTEGTCAGCEYEGEGADRRNMC